MKPKYVVVFYRARGSRPRLFKFTTWANAVEACDRFADRLQAAPVIFDLPKLRATIY